MVFVVSLRSIVTEAVFLGCFVVAFAAGFGALAVAALFTYFGMLGLCLVAGIVFFILSSVVMKIPEVRAKHKILRVVCIILGIALIVFSLFSIGISVALLGSLGQVNA